MPKRIDENQPLIVNALRKAGASVQTLHTIGKGCPDLLIGFRGVNYLAEVKNPKNPPSKRKLTPDEIEWFNLWKGQKQVVETVEDALNMIGVTHPV